eukprot:178720-Pyramimonas_sp.AAC.1
MTGGPMLREAARHFSEALATLRQLDLPTLCGGRAARHLVPSGARLERKVRTRAAMRIEKFGDCTVKEDQKDAPVGQICRTRPSLHDKRIHFWAL